MADQMNRPAACGREITRARHELREFRRAPPNRRRRRHLNDIAFHVVARRTNSLRQGSIEVREIVVRSESAKAEKPRREVEAMQHRECIPSSKRSPVPPMDRWSNPAPLNRAELRCAAPLPERFSLRGEVRRRPFLALALQCLFGQALFEYARHLVRLHTQFGSNLLRAKPFLVLFDEAHDLVESMGDVFGRATGESPALPPSRPRIGNRSNRARLCYEVGGAGRSAGATPGTADITGQFLERRALNRPNDFGSECGGSEESRRASA